MPQPITPTLSVDAVNQLAKAEPGITNKEPGFANTYGPGSSSPGGLLAASVPALGVGGLSLLLMYRQYLQDQEDKKRQLKQADFKSQLPGLHPKDMLLGGALGGGAGLLYDFAAGQPEGRRLSTTLKRVLTGVGIGAAGANLAGDRLRRYVSNTQLPMGYGSNILPRSWQHLYDAAIADKPSFDPAAVDKLTSAFGNNKDVAQAALNARYELVRRSMGIHSDNSATDVWQRNKGNSGPAHYSLNEQNPEYKKLLQRLFLPSALHPASPASFQTSYNDVASAVKNNEPIVGPEAFNKTRQKIIGGRDIAPLFTDPKKTLAFLNSSGNWRNADMLGAGTLLGEQQVMARQRGKNLEGMVLDRFDVTPSKSETDKLMANIKNLNVLRPSWYGKKTDNADGGYYSDTTNKSWLGSLLSRLIWDKLLVEEQPWVSQKFQFVPQGNSNALQFQNSRGEPALPPMSSQQLSAYLMNLQGGQQK